MKDSVYGHFYHQVKEESKWHYYKVSHTWLTPGDDYDTGYMHSSRLTFIYNLSEGLVFNEWIDGVGYKQELIKPLNFFQVNDPDGWSWLRKSENGDRMRKVNNQGFVLYIEKKGDWTKVKVPKNYNKKNHTETWVTTRKPEEWQVSHSTEGRLKIDTFPIPTFASVSPIWAATQKGYDDHIEINHFDILLNREIKLEHVTTFSEAFKLILNKKKQQDPEELIGSLIFLILFLPIGCVLIVTGKRVIQRQKQIDLLYVNEITDNDIKYKFMQNMLSIEQAKALQEDLHKKEAEKKEAKRKRREAERKRREAERKRREAERLKNLTKAFGSSAAKKIVNEKIWKGMTKDMLFESRGAADHIKEDVDKSKRTLKCFYGAYTTRQNTRKYKLRITLENDVVVGWKDL